MKKIIQFLVTLPLIGFAQSWVPATPFPFDGVHHPITFANDSFAYVISGSNTSNVYKYTKSSDSWTQLANFPGGNRGYAYGVAIHNKAYMGFGSDQFSNYYNDWWEFDMTTESWSQLASLPGLGRNHPAMVATSDKIFMGCGSSDMGNFNDWWEYDVASDSWTQKPDLPSYTRHHPFYFGIDNEVYVGFGHGSNPDANGYYIYKDFYKYLPTNDQWIQLNDFPSEARVAGTQFSYNGKGYVLSGDGDNHQSLDSGEFWEYEPSTDQWTQLPSHPGNAIWAPGCFVIGCDLYFLLGQDNNTTPGTLVSNIYTYKLSQDCGCMDPNAVNFSAQAIYEDGSCCYVAGCLDPYAINYNASVCFEDNSCIYPVLGCDNPNAANYNANANTTSCVGGVLDNNFSSGGYFYGDQHLLLDVYEACVIKSAFFEAEISNTITFELRDANGNVLDDTTHTVSPGMQQLILNFDCPVGTDLQLGTSADNTGLFRNNTGANYPYDIGGALSITESSAGSAGYYYYYYNIEVEIGCIGVAIDSWNCINDACVDPQDGSGTYSSLADCENDCYAPSWNCINDACVDPQDGSGTYSSLADCESNCYAPSWNCINDACVDPQDGSGQFSNLLDCKDVCYPTSWNCINAACVDPQDGSGLYTTIADCENMCTTSAIQSVFKLTDKKVKRIVNALGQEINYQTNTPLFIQYQDGTVEKKIIFD